MTLLALRIQTTPFACLVIAWLSGCGVGSNPPGTPGQPTLRQESSGADRAESVRRDTLARFRDVTSQSGIEFTYRNGEEAEHYAILESLGGGIGLLDFDSDGLLDLFAPGGGKFGPGNTIGGLPSALYRNQGERRFQDVSDGAGVSEAIYYSHGTAVSDYDNDGFPDLVLTGYGGLMFFRNQGDGTFAESAEAAGLTDRLWSSSAAWGDINADGAADLYVAHYTDWSFDNNPECPGPKPGEREVCPPRSFNPLPDILYFSNGDGTFRDASEVAGLRKDGKGLGVLMADLNLDGKLDIYVGNDTVPNFLYQNAGNGKLEDTSLISGTSLSETATPDGSMGVDVGDFNLDGLPDLWVANYERESFALYRNEGKGFFQHVSQSAGVTAMGSLFVGWGTVFVDFDRDADEDLFVSNGHVIRHPVNAPLRQKSLLLENLDGNRVVNVAESAGAEYLKSPHMGRGVAAGDIDNDGDIDLAISHTNEPLALLANESPNANHWLTLSLIGTGGSRDSVGALVRVTTGKRVQFRQVKGGTSYASSSDRRLFFGLRDVEKVDAIEIRWPSGSTQTLNNVNADQFLTVIEPVG